MRLLWLLLVLAPAPARAICPPAVSGSLTWNGWLNGADRATAAAVAPGGDLVVGGTGDGGAWVATRLDALGNTLWTVTGGGAPGLGSIVRGVAVDASDNTILAIEDDRSDLGHGRDWLLLALDLSGAMLWSTPYNGSGSLDDVPQAVTIDASSNIIVAGYVTDAVQGERWRIQKYDASGNPYATWENFHDGPFAGGADRATGVDTDSAGRVFVGGWETTAATNGKNWRIRVYDPAGAYLGWFFPSYDNPDATDDIASSLTVDSFGRVILAGSEDRTGSGQGWNWRVIVYNSSGGQIWSATYDSPGSLDDGAAAVTADGCGNVIAAGWETHPTEGLNRVVRKWGPDGLVLWTVTETGPGADADGALAVAVLQTGEAAVAGTETRNDLGEGENQIVRVYGDGCASMDAMMSITPPAPGLCQPFVVTITVTNTGNCLLSGFDAVATPPRIEGPAVFTGGPSSASANPGQGASYSYGYQTTAVGTITISATATGLKQDTGATVSAALVAAATVTVAGPPGPPEVDVVAAVATSPAIPGQAVTYRVDIQNIGSDTALGVTMWDSLPPGLGYVGCAGAPCGMAGSLLGWNVGTLVPAATAQLTFTVIAPGAGTCGTLLNTGDFGEYVQTDWTNVCGDSYVPDRWAGFLGLPAEVRNAVLVPAVTAQPTVLPQGGIVTYTVTVGNVCGDTAVGVTVWDTVPAGAQFLGCAGAGCVLSGGMVGWSLPNLAPFSTYAVTFTVSVTGPGPTLPAANATVAGVNTAGQAQPPVPVDGPAVTVRNPALEIVKTGPPEAMTTDRVTWTITVRNTGTDTAFAVVVTDSLPVPMVYAGSTGGGTATGRLVTWAVSDLPPGAQATVTVTAAGPGNEEEYALVNTGFAACANSAGYRLGFASAPAAILLTPKLIVRVFPVPFNPATARGGTLKISGLPADAGVRIFTTGGLLVRELNTPVRHRLEWDGRNTEGSDAAPGAYLYLITIPGGETIRGHFGVIR